MRRTSKGNEDTLTSAAIYREEDGRNMEVTPGMVVLRLRAACWFAEGSNRLEIEPEELGIRSG